MKFSVSQLPNGLTVATDNIPDAEGASMRWNINAGAAHGAKAGDAHFLEHMIAYSFVAPAIVAFKRLKQMTPSFNLYTGDEFLGGEADIYPEQVPEIIRIFGKAASAPEWDHANLETQRRLIQNEKRDALTYPAGILRRKLRTKLYKGHLVSRDILGEVEDILSMSDADLHGFRQQHFLACDIALVFSGPMRHEENMRMAEENYGRIAPGNNTLIVPPQTLSSIADEIVPQERPNQCVMLASYGVPYNHPLNAPFDIVMEMMKDGLNEFLRDDGFAYDGMDTCYHVALQSFGYTSISYFTPQEQANSSLRAIAKFIGNPELWMSRDMYDHYRVHQKVRDAHSSLSVSNRAEKIISHHQGTGFIKSFEETQKYLRCHTYDDIRAAYEFYKAQTHIVLGCGPCETLPGQDEINDLIQGRSQTVVLVPDMSGGPG